MVTQRFLDDIDTLVKEWSNKITPDDERMALASLYLERTNGLMLQGYGWETAIVMTKVDSYFPVGTEQMGYKVKVLEVTPEYMTVKCE